MPSENIGAFWLDFVYDHGPFYAVLSMLIADFGVIYLLMMFEGVCGAKGPWKRDLYFTFRYNDTIFIPLFMGMAAVILLDAPRLTGFYTTTWWHTLLLVTGFLLSVVIEVMAVKNGQYTWSQELSPSKLWHTFIFGIVFYWITSVLIPVILVHSPGWASALAAVAFVGFISMMVVDGKLAAKGRFKDAHCQWDWHTMYCRDPEVD